MDHNERQALKEKIEADLKLLMNSSWSGDVMSDLHDVLEDLQSIHLEGYDD